MESLKINATEQTPSIILDQENTHFEIAGRSLTDDPGLFYKPVLDWLNHYSKSPNPSTEFIFRFEYLTTDSAKLVFDILATLEKIKGARVIWVHTGRENGIKETGLDLVELVNIPFEFKNTNPL